LENIKKEPRIMKNAINKLEFFLLLEPYIEDLEAHSPLLELALNAPLEEYDKLDIAHIKETLKQNLLAENLIYFEEIVTVFANPEYAYKIALQIDNEKLINELYERNDLVKEYLFDKNGEFSLAPPLSHDDKFSAYLKFIDISEYQLDYTQPKHQFSYDAYVTLNLAFELEKTSREIGLVDGAFIHFTTQDIVEEFEEKNSSVIEGLALLFRDGKSTDETIDFPKQIETLLKKGYLAKVDDTLLSIGAKATTLFENLFMLNAVQFSSTNMKFINNEDVSLKYGMFQSTKKSAFYFHFEKENVIIKIMPDKETLKNTFLKSFEF
jgi:hypothetical protein